ncbi:hypothetical protein GGU11DRAFT_751728 [Lentinula aff. detonsa]|nr:hypothetical protein GGU11DRAFT_751728 [Lentinula aff. detonsa]
MLNASVNSSLPLPAPPADQQQPDTQPSKKKRGARSRSSLSEDQVEIIQTFFPEMEKLLVKHKLHAGKEEKLPDPSEVSTWFDLTITKILKMNAFENLDKAKKTSTQWRTVIQDVFKNYQNNTFIPRNQKSFALRYLQLENNDPRGPQEFIRAADALVSFKNAAAPKKVFERENKSVILDLMNEKIRQSKESVSPGGDSIADLTEGNSSTTRTPNSAALYQNALTELSISDSINNHIDIPIIPIIPID